MANPNFPIDGQSERVDALIDSAGSVFLKLGIGSVNFGGTNNAAWHGAATHKDAATAGANDGVSVAAGLSGTTVKHVLVDSTGALIGVGAGAAAAAIVGNPLRIGASDGTNTRNILSDSGGRLQIVNGGNTDGAGTYVTERISNVFKSVQLATPGSGDSTIWTPTSGKKFRLIKFMILISANMNTASGGAILIKFRDNTTDIGVGISPFIPTTAVTTGLGGFSTGWIDLGPNGVLSALADNVLHLNFGSALTTGTVSVMTAGTEE